MTSLVKLSHVRKLKCLINKLFTKVSFLYKMVKNRMNKDLKTERRIRGASPFTTPPKKQCQVPLFSYSIEECIEEGEFGMNSESHRRILATTHYISYRALQRNTVPCSRKGASYYNCQTGAEANPYSRGCATITRCRNS